VELEPVTLGVDVGQRRDPTALVVAEQHGHGSAASYSIRHVQRLPLGTPYPNVAEHIARLTAAIRERDAAEYGTVYGRGEGPRHMQIRCDATGVGRPVIDLLQRIIGTDTPIVGVTITGTDHLHHTRHQEWSVGKAYLVSRMQALLQTRRLTLPDTPEAKELVQELLNYEIRVAPSTGMLTAGAFGSKHDDLATSLGLAVLEPYAPIRVVRMPIYR